MSEELKKLGNDALQSGKIDEAIKYYSDAIEIDNLNHVLFSNRSAAYCKAGRYQDALKDADNCIKIKSDWSKGYSRKGAALEFMKQFEEAITAYETALKFDPENAQTSKSIRELKTKMSNFGDQQQQGFSFGSLFNDPGFMDKLSKNPRTKEYLNDPSFKMKLEMMKQNPKLMSMMLQDKQIMDVIAVGLGMEPDNIEIRPQDEEMEETKAEKTVTVEEKPRKEKTAGEAMEVDLNSTQDLAAAEKNKGNEAYKAKHFTEAIACYNKAIELEPTNCTFYTNIAAVYYEQNEFENCIEFCNKAIEIGRENRADYKLIAKAYSRAGNAYLKLDDLLSAKKNYEKSLSEHRVQDIVKKLHDVEKRIKEKERLARINPEEAEKEKKLGNIAFQKGCYPDAMKHYNEAIKRNPEDARIYCNRAACYTKLMEFPMAIKDCDSCIQLDPKFVKGYLRKATCLIAMKESSKAADVYRKALDIDPNCEEAKEGLRQTYLMTDDPEEMRKRAMQDPEIQEILSDPAMQIILGQMQKDPAAFKEHLQNPHIATKLQKLMEKGFIAIR